MEKACWGGCFNTPLVCNAMHCCKVHDLHYDTCCLPCPSQEFVSQFAYHFQTHNHSREQATHLLVAWFHAVDCNGSQWIWPIYNANIIQTLQQNHVDVVQGFAMTPTKFLGVFSVLCVLGFEKELPYVS